MAWDFEKLAQQYHKPGYVIVGWDTSMGFPIPTMVPESGSQAVNLPGAGTVSGEGWSSTTDSPWYTQTAPTTPGGSTSGTTTTPVTAATGTPANVSPPATTGGSATGAIDFGDFGTGSSASINFGNMGSWPQSTSESKSGFLDPTLKAKYNNVLDSLMDQMQYFDDSLGMYSELPATIDDWTSELMKRYRVNRNDVIDTLNAVANQRAAQGILGGTEAQNLRATMLNQSMNPLYQLQNQALQNALASKVGVLSEMPSVMAKPMELLTTLLGLGRESEGESTDPNAWVNMLSALLQSGFTGG